MRTSDSLDCGFDVWGPCLIGVLAEAFSVIVSKLLFSDLLLSEVLCLIALGDLSDIESELFFSGLLLSEFLCFIVLGDLSNDESEFFFSGLLVSEFLEPFAFSFKLFFKFFFAEHLRQNQSPFGIAFRGGSFFFC